VSGEFWTIPNGTSAPGNTNPGANVPTIGLTYFARSSSAAAGAAQTSTASAAAAAAVKRPLPMARL
jgi:hypothetical protein